MNLILAIIAGVIQGLTEFLPVSSTAHLIIFQKMLNLPDQTFGLAFDASLHLGTLLAVLIFFFKDYLKVFNFKNQLYLKLIIGTVPAAILGVFLESKIENSFRSLTLIGIALIAFSVVMVLAEKMNSKNKLDKKIDNKKSFIIGLAQALALVPGVSRSGSTISAGLFLGLSREESARFAFLLSGPIIAGAGSKKFLEVLMSGNVGPQGVMPLLAGIVSSFIVGYLTIKYFLKFLAKNDLYPFIAYRVALGLLLLALPFLH